MVNMVVVYFDQQMGVPLPVRWSKSTVFALNKFFCIFSITNLKKKEKDRKAAIKLQ